MTVVVSLTAGDSLSSPVSFRTYEPGKENVAVVTGELALANVTAPGPLTLLHANVSGPATLSSVNEPRSDAAAGRVTATSGPASTVGGLFTGTAAIGAPPVIVQLGPITVPGVPAAGACDESAVVNVDPPQLLKLHRPRRPVAFEISRSFAARICDAERA